MALQFLILFVLAVPTTLLSGRLLGVRRGWLSLSMAGLLGWGLGLAVASGLGDAAFGESGLLLDTVLLSLLFTMMLVVAFDLAAPQGSLATGSEAGLVVVPHPIRDARNTVSYLTRYWELLRIARANGLGRNSLDTTSDGTTAPGVSAARSVRATVEQAGGMFVKLGQVASTRDDVLPSAFCEELALLRSSVEPAPREVMARRVERHLSRPADEVFAAFDWNPIAAGSIAHAYRATLFDGTSVIVKVQRPGLEEAFERDRRALMAAARFVEKRTTLGLSLSPEAMAAEFSDGLAEELDFTIEAGNADLLEAATPDDMGVHIPHIYRELSGRYVLVQEALTGTSVADSEAVAAGAESPDELARRLIRLFFHHIFDEGVFHADPHPGNILLLDDGRLGLIDLGAVGRLGPTERTAMMSLLGGLASGDTETMRQAVEDLATFRDEVRPRDLERAIASMLGSSLAPGAKLDVQLLADLVRLLGEFKIVLRPEITLLIRTLISVEGTLRTISPDFDLLAEARTVAVERLGAPLRGEGIQSLVMKELTTQFPRIRRLPLRVDTVLDQLTTGKLEARVSFLRSDHDVRILTRLVNRVVLGLVAVMLGVGSVLLLGVEGGPELSSAVPLDEVLGYLGLASSAILTLRVVAGIVRDGV
ncbi:MAG TPA: AarF/UbiB family protein [Ilumatobacteraceae bacterium]|jgi:ubiquinone biosynthesis protein|nr:AarF/UbiB family protein [Ilumatobacteraceae bacterium]